MPPVIASEAKDLGQQIFHHPNAELARLLRALCAPSVSSVVEAALPTTLTSTTSNHPLLLAARHPAPAGGSPPAT